MSELHNITYVKFDEIDLHKFLPLLNSQKIRKHLIEHDLFTVDTLTAWMGSKVDVDATAGCRVRGILCDGDLAGWCGIQFEDEKYELAIIIDDKFWGLGKKVYKDLMSWAKDLGHTEVCINFLHTRPDYKFLNKIAGTVSETELMGSKFTRYELAVK